MHRAAIVATFAILLWLGPVRATADELGNPTASQMIDILRAPAASGGTRGIRPNAPSIEQPVAAVGIARAAASPQAAPNLGPRSHATIGKPRAPTPSSRVGESDPRSVNLNVPFRTNSAELTPDAARALDALGGALSSADLASYRFRIEGHTDTVGSRDRNKVLSEQRAATVVDYLVSRHRIDRKRLEAAGLGEGNLIVATPDQTPEPRNRRVVISNIGT